MKGMKIKQSLEKFLKEKGVYDAYMANIQGQWRYDTVSKLSGYICFAASFLWSGTPEGVDFWHELANEFDKIDNGEEEF